LLENAGFRSAVAGQKSGRQRRCLSAPYPVFELVDALFQRLFLRRNDLRNHLAASTSSMVSPLFNLPVTG
jgi:hypothetical protein